MVVVMMMIMKRLRWTQRHQTRTLGSHSIRVRSLRPGSFASSVLLPLTGAQSLAFFSCCQAASWHRLPTTITHTHTHDADKRRSQPPHTGQLPGWHPPQHNDSIRNTTRTTLCGGAPEERPAMLLLKRGATGLGPVSDRRRERVCAPIPADGKRGKDDMPGLSPDVAPAAAAAPTCRVDTLHTRGATPRVRATAARCSFASG